ncbi:precorrin-8X methylmutase [Fusibacter sp. 3D3]|uniref:precorrin-8X methylmutase n=1 Tax=Fusibacter sp. 3D3 TaxID=1048380 RepID=UPI0008536ED3|nr:precorrin-8X methylmutase [Fusibacter sp. 3D3]GAU76898.1 cobalt-precorrin-8x methylmutase [Fusibacter sp. 3D3]
MKFEYKKDPMGIERESFEIIDGIIASASKIYPSGDPLIQNIYRRVIHTSADFDYLDNLKIEDDFITAFSQVIANENSAHVTVYTDTNMVLSGINKTAFNQTGWQLKCFVANEEAQTLAKAQGITRSMASIQLALKEPGKKIFVFGNAPTAIFQVLDLQDEFKESLIGIIGVPVGFVGAEESKLALYNSTIPCITALGRKGGSNVAASIVNALIYHFKERA